MSCCDAIVCPPSATTWRSTEQKARVCPQRGGNISIHRTLWRTWPPPALPIGNGGKLLLLLREKRGNPCRMANKKWVDKLTRYHTAATTHVWRMEMLEHMERLNDGHRGRDRFSVHAGYILIWKGVQANFHRQSSSKHDLKGGRLGVAYRTPKGGRHNAE